MADEARTWTPKKALLAAGLAGLACLLAGFGIGWLTGRSGTDGTAPEPVERPPVFWDENDPGEMRLQEFLKTPYLKDRLPVSPPPLAGAKNENQVDPEPSQLAIALISFRKPLCDVVTPAQASTPGRPGVSEDLVGAGAEVVELAAPELEAKPKAITFDADLEFLPDAPVVTGLGPESGALQGLDVPGCLRRIGHPAFSVNGIRKEPEPERFSLMPAFIAADWSSRQEAAPERLLSPSTQPPWPGALPELAPKAGPVVRLSLSAAPEPDLVRQRADPGLHAGTAHASPASLAERAPLTIPFPRPKPEVVLADRPADKPVEQAKLPEAVARRQSHPLPASARSRTVATSGVPPIPATLVAKRPESSPAPAVGATWPALAIPPAEVRWPAHEGQMPGLYTPADLTPAPVPRSAPTLPWP